MSDADIADFRNMMADLYREYRSATGVSLVESDYYTAKLDKNGVWGNNQSMKYVVGWIVSSTADQVESSNLMINSPVFRLGEYYEVMKFAPIVFVFNYKDGFVTLDKCEVGALQGFSIGSLKEFYKYIQDLQVKSGNTAWSSGLSIEPKKHYLCDCGANATLGVTDKDPTHAFWCTARRTHGA